MYGAYGYGQGYYGQGPLGGTVPDVIIRLALELIATTGLDVEILATAWTVLELSGSFLPSVDSDASTG